MVIGAKRPLSQTATPPQVKLGIKSQAGDEMYFRVALDKKFQGLFMKYCMENNLDYKTVAFFYDGKRIKSTMTPAEFGMEDEEIIDAMVHQTGGGGFN
ncbi:hypothetical protein RD792_009731 [Penstemon davidsonii]|nr:hypothetical protein RD792_009731 [Penstemon davidsonii]